MLQAVADGLGINALSRDIGQADGARGALWQPPAGFDVLSYALGYVDGQRFGRGRSS